VDTNLQLVLLRIVLKSILYAVRYVYEKTKAQLQQIRFVLEMIPLDERHEFVTGTPAEITFVAVRFLLSIIRIDDLFESPEVHSLMRLLNCQLNDAAFIMRPD
jgi:hypothetical protein